MYQQHPQKPSAIFCDFVRFLVRKTLDFAVMVPTEGVLLLFLRKNGFFEAINSGKSFFSLFRLITCISTTYEKTKCDFGAILVRFCAKKRGLMSKMHSKLSNSLLKNRIFRTKSQFFAPLKVLIDNKLSLFCDFAILIVSLYNYDVLTGKNSFPVNEHLFFAL